MRVAIIDDEKHCQDSLEQLLIDNFPHLYIVGFADDVITGIALINEKHPDLVFLDVELGNDKSFEILNKTQEKNFQVVFVTAHNHYAVNAFRFSAIDFLQKPVVLDELREAISKTATQLQQANLETQLAVMNQALENISDQDRKIVLKGLDALHIVRLKEILWCSAEGSYTKFHLLGGKEVVISKHLKEYQGLLASNRFYRVHRSFLVNLNHIIRYDRSEGMLFFSGEIALPVSLKRDRMDELIEKI